MIYSHDTWDALLETTVQRIKELSALKGGEYAGDDDRLANFRRNAEAAGTTMEFVWRIYAAKHWDAVMQYERDLREDKTRERMESIAGRLDDLIVYCILMKAMVEERDHKQRVQADENSLYFAQMTASDKRLEDLEFVEVPPGTPFVYTPVQDSRAHGRHAQLYEIFERKYD